MQPDVFTLGSHAGSEILGAYQDILLPQSREEIFKEKCFPAQGIITAPTAQPWEERSGTGDAGKTWLLRRSGDTHP